MCRTYLEPLHGQGTWLVEHSNSVLIPPHEVLRMDSHLRISIDTWGREFVTGVTST